jgi:hypothetical protein
MAFRDFAADRSFSGNSLWQRYEKLKVGARHMGVDLDSYILLSNSEYGLRLKKTERCSMICPTQKRPRGIFASVIQPTY